MSKPEEVLIDSNDWWVKVLGMLQQNWALVDKQGNDCVKVFFFYDNGHTLSRKFSMADIDGYSGYIDTLSFNSVIEAIDGLSANGFLQHNIDSNNDYMRPLPPYFDATDSVEGPYSNGEFWL